MKEKTKKRVTRNKSATNSKSPKRVQTPIKEKNKDVICIIGMHRSGTSLVARLLNLCGLDLGPPEQIMEPLEDNPLGFFENKGFHKINEALLAHFDGSWDNPPHLKEDWEYDVSLEQFVRQARELIKTFATSRQWGWKDPRTAMLLPFWKSLIHGLRFVICVRSPLEVAKSLARRDRMPIQKGVYLWNQHMQTAIKNTDGCPRIFTFYEDFFKEDASDEINRLAEFCSLQEPADLSGLHAAISHELKHHTSDTIELLNDDKLTTEHKLFYIGLRALTTKGFTHSASDRTPVDLISENVSKFLKLLEQFHNEQEIAQLQSTLTQKDQHILNLTAAMDQQQQELGQKDEHVKQFLSQQDDLNEQLGGLRAVLHEKEEQVNQLQATLQNQQTTLEQKEKQVAQLTAGRKLLDKEATKLQTTVQNQQTTLEQKEKQVAQLTAGRKLLDKEATKVQATVQSQEEALADKDQQIAEKDLNVEQIQIAVGALEEKMNRIRHNLEAILNSRSWKLTTPLRQLYHRLFVIREWQRYMQQRLRLKIANIRKVEHFCDIPLSLISIEANHQNPQQAAHWIPSLKIYHDVKNALSAHPPSTLKYQLKVPPKAVLQTFVALHPTAWGQNPGAVEFIISVSSRSNGRSLSRKCWSHPTRFSQHRHWMEFRVNLSQFANQEVDLTLSTSVQPKATENYEWALWGNPAIMTRKSFRSQSLPDKHLKAQRFENLKPPTQTSSGPEQIPDKIATKEKNLNSVPQPEYEKAVCTVISKNYLAFARVFTRSFLKHHPGVKVFVLLVDKVDGYFDPAAEPFDMVLMEQLDNIPNPSHFFFKYTVIELNTAVKPYFFQYLFKKYSIGKLIYFDPDILILHPLEQLWNLLDENSIVLTPHLTEPIHDKHRPGEIDIMRSGAYNLGFIAMSNVPSVQDFLQWWLSRLYDFCYVGLDDGLFVDQKWVDLVPGLFEGSYILKDPEYNIAYWNFHSRAKKIKVQGDGVHLNGKPVRFFHFSGFDPNNINQVSKHQDRFTLKSLPNLKPLFKRYRDLLLAEGYEQVRKWPYAYACFDNEVQIPDLGRKHYRGLGEKALEFGNPYSTQCAHSFLSWLNQSVEAADNTRPEESVITRIWYELYKARTDLQQAFPDVFGIHQDAFITWTLSSGKYEQTIDPYFILKSPNVNGAKPSNQMPTFDASSSAHMTGYGKQANQTQVRREPLFGVNIAGYINSEKGLGEAVRSEIRNLEAAGIPFVVHNIGDAHSENTEKISTKFSEHNPYDVNLIHVNADQAPLFAQQKKEYLLDRYNVGYWTWELSSFPEEWYDSFKHFNEIWVPSNFVQDAVSRVSPIPVIRVPHSINPKPKIGKKWTRSRFGLNSDTFMFLFMFDFCSYMERKNPLGLVQAFRKAFGDKENVALLIKCSHSSVDPDSFALLQEACKPDNIKLLDTILPRDAVNALLSTCDCYTSLHRSEGFGLTLSEAMSMGKPTIATDYSANKDFMKTGNSFLVKHRVVEIETDHGPYKKGCFWADPDIEHAAELMRFVYENRTAVAVVAKKGQQEVIGQLHPKVVGAMMRERLSFVQSVYSDKLRAESAVPKN